MPHQYESEIMSCAEAKRIASKRNAQIRTGRRGWSEAYKPGFKPRNRTLCLMASDDEAAAIDAAAKAEGITRSAWLTKAAMLHLDKTHGNTSSAKPMGTRRRRNP